MWELWEFLPGLKVPGVMHDNGGVMGVRLIEIPWDVKHKSVKRRDRRSSVLGEGEALWMWFVT